VLDDEGGPAVDDALNLEPESTNGSVSFANPWGMTTLIAPE